MIRVLVMQVVGLMAASTALAAQDPHLSKDAPRDRPVNVATDEHKRRFDAAIAAYVAKARATYPQAKQRFLAGLPPRQSFFVTAELRDDDGHSEMVFLAVDSLARDSAFGRIWNQIKVVHGYRLRDRYATAEATLVDWLITRPDGTEEGNVVGKFLDTYQP